MDDLVSSEGVVELLCVQVSNIIYPYAEITKQLKSKFISDMLFSLTETLEDQIWWQR